MHFDYTLDKIRHRDSQTSLLDIAYECGYYDHAQVQEGLSLSHPYFPKNESIGIQKSEIGYLRSFRLNERETSLLLGGHYTFSLFDFEKDKYSTVATSKLEEFHTFSLRAGYRISIGSDWSLLGLLMPYFSSTLNSDADLQSRDFGVDGVFTFTKGGPTSYLTLGLAYSSQSGLPFPIPIISYHGTANKAWDYTLGHFLFIQKYEIKIPPKELYDFDTGNTLYLNAGLQIGL